MRTLFQTVAMYLVYIHLLIFWAPIAILRAILNELLENVEPSSVSELRMLCGTYGLILLIIPTMLGFYLITPFPWWWGTVAGVVLYFAAAYLYKWSLRGYDDQPFCIPLPPDRD